MKSSFFRLIYFILINVSFLTSSYANDKANIIWASSTLEILPALQLNDKYCSISDNIIFLHIPKVGGTSLIYVFEPAIPKEQATRFSVPREKGISPILITSGWIGGLKAIKEKCSHADKACKEYKFVSGHFPFGVHNYLPGNYKYITLVRHPVEREISSINFDYQRGYIEDKNQAEKYLLEVAIDNPQTRLIAGENFMSGSCDEKTLEIAKQNLDKYFLVTGITEDTDKFIQAVSSMYNIMPAAIARTQVTYDKIFDKVPKNIQQKLLAKHKYDLKLYEHVKKNGTNGSRII